MLGKIPYQHFKSKEEAKGPNSIIRAVGMLYNNCRAYKSDFGYAVYNILRVGSYIEAKSYFSDDDREYRVIGFTAEVECKITEQDEIKVYTMIIPVWTNNNSDLLSIYFVLSQEKLEDAKKFMDGQMDITEVTNLIAHNTIVKKAMKFFIQGELAKKGKRL